MNISPGDRVLFMKVGTHAGEELEDIIERKRAEIDAAGFSLWGYGGNTCHPRTMVQPFARSSTGPIILAMQPMKSNHFADPVRAEEYSADGVHWSVIDPAINVLGSRYALAVDSLEIVKESLDLGATTVAVGNSKGKAGNEYLKGRVDKACLEVLEARPTDTASVRSIGLQANIIDPYAVFLRN